MCFFLLLWDCLRWYGFTDPLSLPYLPAFAYCALVLLGVGRLFQKAGKRPWTAFVPFVGAFQLYAIAWQGSLGLLSRVLLLAGLLLHYEGGAPVVEALCWVSLSALTAMLKFRLCRAFGKGVGFFYCSLFCEGLCFLLLGFGPSAYGDRPREEPESFSGELPEGPRRLQRLLSLFACGATLLVSVAAICWGVVRFLRYGIPVEKMFHYFTVHSALLAAFSAACLLPNQFRALRSGRFVCPRPLLLLQYSAAFCMGMTMFFAVGIISVFDPEFAFGYQNYWLHLVSPVLALLSFFTLDSDTRLRPADTLAAMLPFFLYSALYALEVLWIGEARGGWQDFYSMTRYTPPALSLSLMYLIAFGVASVIRMVFNRLAAARRVRFAPDTGTQALDIRRGFAILKAAQQKGAGK